MICLIDSAVHLHEVSMMSKGMIFDKKMSKKAKKNTYRKINKKGSKKRKEERQNEGKKKTPRRG